MALDPRPPQHCAYRLYTLAVGLGLPGSGPGTDPSSLLLGIPSHRDRVGFAQREEVGDPVAWSWPERSLRAPGFILFHRNLLQPVSLS